MKFILSVVASLLLVSHSFGQHDFIQIETNKTLGLFSFLETSSQQIGTSSSFTIYILTAYQQDQAFNQLINTYAGLNLDYSFNRQEFPERRPSYTSTKDLLWIAASNSKDIDDFSQRIIGLLPHTTHTQFIALLHQALPYYEELVWKKEQENIRKIEDQLANYKSQISDLYLQISRFYNTTWDTSIPFKIELYPIPLESGNTTAIPKGNLLICGFLSHNENEYKGLLGIIIHEMCHILYEAQSVAFQHQMEQWFAQSSSPYAPLANSFINEGLATALGNGWAYKQIHSSIDSGEWYNNKHIDGFAHAIFPLVERYLAEGKSIDQDFVDESIELFEQTFPKATQEAAILMNSLQLFANTEKEDELNEIANTIHQYFNIRSMYFSTPILSAESQERFDTKQVTKLFIVESENTNTIKGLQQAFPHLTIETPLNSIDIVKDETTNSILVIMNINGLDKLQKGYSTLASIPYFEHGTNHVIN
jgi:hypothetical protein